MKKRLLFIVAVVGYAVPLVLMAAGCDVSPSAPLRDATSANAGVRVTVMTEFDGIRLYEVEIPIGLHLSQRVYVAKSIDSLSASWREQQGKMTVLRETQTIER